MHQNVQWNALSMEALPIFLDKMLPEIAAILLSVSFVLLFGEVIPQAVCSKYGMAIGYYSSPLVYFLLVISMLFFAFLLN